MSRVVRVPYTVVGIPASTFVAKGDVLVGLGDGLYTVLSGVGVTDGWVIGRDSSTPTGLVWQAAGGGGGGGPTLSDDDPEALGAAGPGVGTEASRSDHVHAMPDTDDIAEGVTNLYWTTARADTWLTGKSTSNLAEGTNLYWTNTRFDTRLGTSSVTDLSDVTDVGSGIIISAAERTAIGTATTHIANSSNPHSVTAAQVGADPEGTAASAVATHAGLSDPHPGYVLETLFDAQTVLAATLDDTPFALLVGEGTIVGRAVGGNVTALTGAQVRTIANVEDGADATNATSVLAALAANTADVDLNSQNITGAGTVNGVTMSEVVISTDVGSIVALTQAAYDALSTPRDASIFYLVTS